MHAKSTRPSAKREVQKERSATIESRALGSLKLASEARDENVPAKRADFFSIRLLPLSEFVRMLKKRKYIKF